MQSVGIDMSAEPKGTAIATVTWHPDHAVVGSVKTGAEDGLVLHYLHHPDAAVGVDCPLGWPAPFVEFIGQHEAGRLVVPWDRTTGWRREFVMRSTDLFVREYTGLVPLSVAADRIGHTALRLAAIMTEVGSHVNTTRDGSGSIVEVYPAAALRVWGLPDRGYKGKSNARNLNALVDEMKRAAPWLVIDHAEEACRTSDDAFDAVVCALVARAAKTGHTVPPVDRSLARREGWIHVPDGGLPPGPWIHRAGAIG